MSARAEHIPTDSRAIVIARAEHIHTEAEPGAVAGPAALRRRKVRASYALNSRLRGCETEVAIHDDHFAAVRTVRPDAEPRKYEVDLRQDGLHIARRPMRISGVVFLTRRAARRHLLAPIDHRRGMRRLAGQQAYASGAFWEEQGCTVSKSSTTQSRRE